MFEGQTVSGPRGIGADSAVGGHRRAVEQHVLDPNMIVKPFEMPQPRRRTGHVQMQGRRAVPGQIDVKRLAQRRDLQEGGDAAAAGHIGLLHVDGLCLQHVADIVDGVGIFAGRDFHAGRSPLAARAQASQIVGRDRFLEPADLLFGKPLRELESLLQAVGAIGVDEQDGLCADGLFRGGDPLAVKLRP